MKKSLDNSLDIMPVDDIRHERRSAVRTLRMYAIDDAVRSGKLPTAGMLADKLGVSIRTIMRDIEFLRDSLGAPLEYDMDKGGWRYTEPTFFLKYTPISATESFSLLLLQHLLSEYANTPLEECIRGLIDRLVMPFDLYSGEKGVEREPFTSQYLTYIPDVLPVIDSAVFNTVFRALNEHLSMQFDYRGLNDDKAAPRCADVYHVVCQRGAWYIVAWCHDKNAIRLFNFSRMSCPRVTDEHYTIPQDFEITKYIDTKMGVWATEHEVLNVQLLFDKNVAVFARERKWSDAQTIKENDDGTVTVCFETTQMTETARLVLGQCGTCEVISPAELRERVYQMAQKIASRHNT